ncbi:MAG: hypothetical protein LLF94_12370 [Chlamydiales bacterium]|nr:hypothetical protein [Chlamydiales bacterium]
MKTDFFRTADSTYLGYVTTQDNRTLEVSVDFSDCPQSLIKPEQRREVVNKLFNDVLEAKDKEEIYRGAHTVDFRANNRNFVIKPKVDIWLQLISYIFTFFQINKSSNKVEYKITTALLRSERIFTPKLNVEVQSPTGLTIGDSLTKLKTAKAYCDPFTELATKLFQDFEQFHSWKDVKDHPLHDASSYHMVFDGSSLVAKSISDTQKKGDIVYTLGIYRDFIVRQFGEEVLKRIQVHYGFDLEYMIQNKFPLTPEIVYRVNVGTTHLEITDIKKLVADIKASKTLPERLLERVKELGIPVHKIDIHNPEHFAKLVAVLSPSALEAEKVFTGRKLHGKIASWYTQGDDELYKPWVDQQELFQTCLKIPGRESHKAWECFYEDLALILCKKHLHQKSLDDKAPYRVGALIPAPTQDGYPQRYYKVTSWIHNSRGIFSYTLEAACPGMNLPVIKLYRSTAASGYTLDGDSSITNDFNPLNSPGYEGAHFLDEHEKAFFDARTIPVWVGYQHFADKKLQAKCALQEVYDNLVAANEALQLEVKTKYKKPTLKEFVRKHDSEFLDLIRDVPKIGIKSYYKAWVQLNTLRHIVRNDSDEQDLKAFLESLLTNEELAPRAKSLLSWWNWEQKNPNEQENALLAKLQQHQTSCASKPLDRSTLGLWSRVLLEHAKANKEHIENKKAVHVDFVGHSLGAACAQRFLVHYTTSSGRIPVPGHTVFARVFDDPAINTEDNDAFIEFGNKHAQLLAALQSKFAIIRRQEAKDPIPQCGETHLGAMKTQEEVMRSYKWLRFDAAVHEASEKALEPQVRDYATAHGRLFAAATRKKGRWYRKLLKEAALKVSKTNVEQQAILTDLQKNLGTDYKITHYCPKTQWNFDHFQPGDEWDSLHAIWKLPFPSFFTSKMAEQVRSYISAAFRSGFFGKVLPRMISQIGYRRDTSHVGHGEWQKHCDARRVFVVKDIDLVEPTPPIPSRTKSSTISQLWSAILKKV